MDKSKKKVLIIANQFPPMGGSGVQRTSKFVKYLPLFGYEAIVLTRDQLNLSLRDDSLLSDIPPNTEIIRTKAYDYSNNKGIMKIPGKILARKVLIPDGERIWADKSISAAIGAIKKHNISLIYTTSYPYSDHLLGLKIKQSIPDIKWVADFRDEWTNNPYTLDNPHNPWRTRKEKEMEYSVLTSADALISNTPVMVRNFIRLNKLPESNFHCIPNGYDADDFKHIETSNNRNQRFTLTYTGALYGRRRPDTFFAALKALLSENKVSKDKISVRLIGNYLFEKLNADIESYGLSGIVTVVKYMPHKECLNMLSESDALLLIEGSGQGSEAFYTGKIFEYMMSKAPVLAIIPEKGAAADLLRSVKIGMVADFDNIDKIKDCFMHYYSQWENNERGYSPDYEEIAKYERKELTKKLAEIFDGINQR